MASAVREAVANVASHAGTGEAWVEVSLTASGADAAAPGGVQVTVRDAGTGFDPARVDPARLGLRRSITERLADCGGQAFIRSAPGQGTLVSLSWIQSEPPSEAVLAGPASDRWARPW
jgi:signal transduction histidine kinase